jgi:hypothetical protein
MLRYSDVKTYLDAGLTALGYGATNPDVVETARTMPLLDPGPFTQARVLAKSPQAMLIVSVGSGIGLQTEGLYDRVLITVRAVGMQNNYDYAEQLADDVDRLLLDAVNGVRLGSAHTLYVHRTGGAPQLVELDAGERYHFQGSYITEVKR